jgi:hypothetical protein
MPENPGAATLFPVRYEDLTREQIIHLILTDSIKLIQSLDLDHLLLIVDGVAKADASGPEPAPVEETWRRMLREQKYR